MSTCHYWTYIFVVRRQGPDWRKGCTMNSTATVRPGEGWTPSGCTLPVTHHAMTTSNHTIPDRSSPGSTRTVPSAVHQVSSMLLVHHRRFEEETTSPWALGTQGHYELQGNFRHQHMKWTGTDGTSLDSCEMRWKHFAETTTEDIASSSSSPSSIP